MQPLVSIITINYNNANGLKATVESVIDQVFRDFEFLIIDGGSTDESQAIIDTHKDHFSYWVSEPDGGIFEAQNKGITAAKGQYLLFLNSGDSLNGPNALGNFVNAPEFSGDIIYGDYKYETGGKTYPDNLTPLFFFKSSLPHQSTLFKRIVFEQQGHYDTSLRIAADRAYYIKCFLANKYQFSHVPQALSFFDLSGVSNDPSFAARKNEEDTRVLKQYFGIYYDDYVKLIELNTALSAAKRNTPKGILKRIKRRLFK
jgi:glycosyltransferase involved in cell wall biosynthesis